MLGVLCDVRACVCEESVIVGVCERVCEACV